MFNQLDEGKLGSMIPLFESKGRVVCMVGEIDKIDYLSIVCMTNSDSITAIGITS
jgi:hypothetical protein